MSSGQGQHRPEILENFKDDLWREAVPLPFYGVRKVCQCRKKFWKTSSYERHYRKEHADPRVWRRTPIGNIERARTEEPTQS